MKNELIFGTEPYLINAYRKEVSKGVDMPDINMLETGQFTETERDFARQAPFMASRRVLILQFEKLQANALLEKYLEKPPQKTDLFIFVKEVDKRLAVYKRFPKDGIRQFDKDGQMMGRFLLNFVKKNDCKITKQAYEELLYRLNYDMEEVTLYDVKSALEKLCTTSSEITPELVKRLIPLNEKEDVFRLIRLIDEKRTAELFHQADLMLENGEQNVIGTLSLLLRSYRILYKLSVCGCTLKEAGVHARTFVPKLTGRQADEGVSIIQDAVNGIKGGKYPLEFALRFCLSKLCQLKNE